ncbi:MAG: hypothetical protein ACJ74C_03780 [Gaiellaceae bacterium]
MAAMLVVVPGGSASAPVITPIIFGTLGANGWYTSNVTINWSFDGNVESSEGCNARTISADTTGTSFTCSATRDGFTTTVTKTFRVDKTPPAVAPALERQPDANGWYNQPVTVAFTATDATSGVLGCGTVRYAGPDTAGASVAGTCTDRAGNGAGGSVAFKYDATPPTLFALTAKTANRTAEVSWRASADTAVVEVFRAPGRNAQGETAIYRGSETGLRDTGLVPGRKYEYRVAGVDQAANRVESKVDVTATGALFSPLPGAVVAAPPTLAWASVKGASYYNVQLIRGRKIFSAWPARTSFRLPRTWSYKGRRYKLRPGVYRWYVWPGFGRVSAAKYGGRLGGSSFVIPP